jgi:ABC-type sugar transport system substrate-binding protein
MDDDRRLDARRVRTIAAATVGAVVLAAAGALASIGLAKGSPLGASQSPGKVTICHHTHSLKHPFVTITVSVRAWPAHRRHGDTIGACGTTTTATTATTMTTETSTLTPTTPSPGKSGEHGKGKAHGHGK